MKILITGASGYIGEMLLHQFVKREDVTSIIAVDIKPLPETLFAFLKADISDPLVYQDCIKKITFVQDNLVHTEWLRVAESERPEIVIHAAWHLRTKYGKMRVEQRHDNVVGSQNVFAYALQKGSGVKKLIYFSTIASYGADKENSTTVPFTEEDKFRKTDFAYAEDKRVVEENLIKLVRESSDIPEITILRPASITGPKAKYLRKGINLQAVLMSKIPLLGSIFPTTRLWLRQYIHEDDILESILRVIYKERPQRSQLDTFNLCPPGAPMRAKDMSEILHKFAVYFHPYIFRLAFFFVWHLTRGKIPVSTGGWKSYSYPILVDGTKFSKTYEYTYQYDAIGAYNTKSGIYSRYIK